MYTQHNGHKKRPLQTPRGYIVVCVISQGRVCDSSRKVTTAGTGVSPGVVRSVSICLEESASSAGTVEPTRGPSHLQQSLLCTAELGHPQVTLHCILQVNQGSICSWSISAVPAFTHHSKAEYYYYILLKQTIPDYDISTTYTICNISTSISQVCVCLWANDNQVIFKQRWWHIFYMISFLFYRDFPVNPAWNNGSTYCDESDPSAR